jgi:hypothetical protein
MYFLKYMLFPRGRKDKKLVRGTFFRFRDRSIEDNDPPQRPQNTGLKSVMDEGSEMKVWRLIVSSIAKSLRPHIL